MREEDGIGAAPTALALPRRGLVVLKNVIQLLREEARFVDEEGDDTNALEELLEALCADGVAGTVGGQIGASKSLPKWTPCNEGCDPACGGFRTQYCKCPAANAALGVALPFSPSADEPSQ